MIFDIGDHTNILTLIITQTRMSVSSQSVSGMEKTQVHTCMKAPSTWPMSMAGFRLRPASITMSTLSTCKQWAVPSLGQPPPSVTETLTLSLLRRYLKHLSICHSAIWVMQSEFQGQDSHFVLKSILLYLDWYSSTLLYLDWYSSTLLYLDWYSAVPSDRPSQTRQGRQLAQANFQCKF